MKQVLQSILVVCVICILSTCRAEPPDPVEKEESSKPAALKSETPKNGFALEKAVIDRQAPDFTLTDAEGNTHSLSDFEGKHVVLEWINFDCPFVKKHYKSSNMQNLQESYTNKDVVWLTVCSSAPGKQGYFSGQELQARISEHKLKSTAYLLDTDGKVGRAYEAKTTPHMYVINPEGVLVYAGAIDSKRSTKAADIPGAVNYVKEALDASLAGGEVKTRMSTPYGCSVKY
jgi:peroxiredoxin